MKKLLAVLIVMLMAFALLPAGAEEANPMDWYLKDNYWRTVMNGHWSSDPKDQITDEELAKMFELALLQQNAVQWTEPFFIVVKDMEEQRKNHRRRLGQAGGHGHGGHRHRAGDG